MTGILSNIANMFNLSGGQQVMPAGFIGPQQPPVQGPPSFPSIGDQISQGYTKISEEPGFNNALFKLGATLLAARQNNMGLGESLLAGQGAYNSEIDRARQIASAKAAAQLELQKFMTDTAFKLNTANLEQNKFASNSDLERQKLALEKKKFENPTAPAEIEAAKQIMASNPGMNFTDAYLTAKNGMIMGGGQGITGAIAPGDLSSLPAQQAAQVKALAEGRMQFPTGFALKSPYWQQMLSNVSQYDPNFDAVNYNARSQTRKAFTSGKEGATINALNTAIGHLGELKDAADALHNTSIPMLNSVENNVNIARGKPEVTNFRRVVNSVAPELVKAYRGSGGAEADIKTTLGDFNPNASPDQLNGSLGETAKLLQSKIDALNEQYSKGMGTSSDVSSFISPKSKATLQKLGLLNSGINTPNEPTATGALKPIIHYSEYFK